MIPPRVALLAVACLALVGCASPQPTSGPPATSDPPGVFFPTVRDPGRGILLTQVTGTLDLIGPCIVVRPDVGGPVFLVIWPRGYRTGLDARGVIVSGPDGSARIGDKIGLVGGLWEDSAGADIRPQVEALIGRPVPDECDFGIYWVGALKS